MIVTGHQTPQWRLKYSYYSTVYIMERIKLFRNQSINFGGTHNQSIMYAGAPLFVALVRGDIKSMFSYEDHPEKVEVAVEEKKDN